MKKIPVSDPPPLSHNPFAKLAPARDALPPGEVRPAPAPAAQSREPTPARAVVRLERKGRGGKEVTVVEQLGLRAKDLAVFVKALKQSLGCGGGVEGETLVLQGDQVERVCVFLAARGVKKVIRGT